MSTPITPIITSTPAKVTTGMPGLTASVPAQAASSYAWTITGGTITSATTGTSIIFTAGAPGSLVLGCTVTNAAGTASTPGSLTLTVVANPITLPGQIRNHVAAQLATTTNLTVIRAPRADVPVGQLPAICLFSHSDQPVDKEVDCCRPHPRIYTLAVDLTEVGRGEEDTTDALAIKVRHALLADSQQGGLVAMTTWTDQQWAGAETADGPLAGSVLLFSFRYMWRPEW